MENRANQSAHHPTSVHVDWMYLQAVEGVKGRSDEVPLSPLYTNEGGVIG